jgi:uncharacterized membrane protein (UPF0127 family)
LLLIVACSPTGEVTGVPTPSTPADSPTTMTIDPVPVEPDVGDLDGWETITITVGAEGLLVALADDSGERTQGLMGVDDLGDLDGMLFVFPQETNARFWMKDTLISLDIAFFGDGGALVDALTMQACSADPCPSYVSAGPFSWALETPVGSLGPLAEGSILSLEG